MENRNELSIQSRAGRNHTAPWALILQKVLEGHPCQPRAPAQPPVLVLSAQTCPQLAGQSFLWLL